MCRAASLTDRILSLHGWVALAIVFAVPALEASAFLGFVFPGELAVLLGGVLAYEHRISLPAAIAAAVAGAIIGDTAGYFIGRRWGRRLLYGTLGHLPLIRHHLDESLDKARDYVRRRRGGPRSSADSPLPCGCWFPVSPACPTSTSRPSSPTTPPAERCGPRDSSCWGFFGRAGYRHVEKIASRLGLTLFALILVGLVVSRVARRSDRLQALGDRLAATPPLAWVCRAFPRQVAWGRRRLDPQRPTGFPPTFTLAAGALAAWAFGGLTQDVVGHDEVYRVDPHVQAFVLAHRTGWFAGVMKVVTWCRSTAILIPLGTHHYQDDGRPLREGHRAREARRGRSARRPPCRPRVGRRWNHPVTRLPTTRR